MQTIGVLALLRRERFLAISALTTLAFYLFGDALFGGLSSLYRLALIFFWLFSVVLGSALAVVRHAEGLAEKLGEPYGTLILTLCITSIEVVSITAIMLHGENNPTLARDTLFAVTMIVLNGMVGLSLLLGGWRYREQYYNLQGANTYLGVIIPLGVLCLVMPDFIATTSGPPRLSAAQKIFVATVSLGLYVAFLALQTSRHRAYFTIQNTVTDESEAPEEAAHSDSPLALHVILLVIYMSLVVYLAEKLAPPVDYVVETMGKPAALAGLAMAVLVATPEIIGAVRAAGRNNLQRSMNIFLGSVLSTIGLTIPAIIVISELTQHPVRLGLEHTDLMLFVLTLGLCMVTFSSGRTNILQGGVHLILFLAYLFLIFAG
ncbi:calcium:proton antiporter [Dyella nitratireducens]|uniref:Calcium:proton antiporter n=1 Tax=Dyella nitratireducens TaxID=1849580 RepID=A0ABQ1FL71_9GAMM|nr:calcium:proton antiporter [Dyella nitratireducens]GGA19417.1 calcium:proton antiporter [Dyella nitratireducens]GLQ44512.1 calcium:proton antiporter [Dyella nitratireducens]